MDQTASHGAITHRDSSEHHVDNRSAIRTMKSEMMSTAAKHIPLRYHFIKDEISKGLMSGKWCPTKDLLADILTKALSLPTYEGLRCYIHVVKRKSQVE